MMGNMKREGGDEQNKSKKERKGKERKIIVFKRRKRKGNQEKAQAKNAVNHPKKPSERNLPHGFMFDGETAYDNEAKTKTKSEKIRKKGKRGETEEKQNRGRKDEKERMTEENETPPLQN